MTIELKDARILVEDPEAIRQIEEALRVLSTTYLRSGVDSQVVISTFDNKTFGFHFESTLDIDSVYSHEDGTKFKVVAIVDWLDPRFDDLIVIFPFVDNTSKIPNLTIKEMTYYPSGEHKITPEVAKYRKDANAGKRENTRYYPWRDCQVGWHIRYSISQQKPLIETALSF